MLTTANLNEDPTCGIPARVSKVQKCCSSKCESATILRTYTLLYIAYHPTKTLHLSKLNNVSSMPARKATLTSTMANFFGRHTKPDEPMSPSHLSPPVPPVPAKYSKQHASSATYLATTSLLGMSWLFSSFRLLGIHRPNSGKVAIVTGSSRSTGAAIARCLGEHGAHVVVNYLTDLPAAEEVVRHIRSQGKGGAIAVQADAASMEGGQRLIDETMRTFGRIDILVMNSGLMGSKTLNDLDEPFFDNMFLTNVKAPLFFVKKAAPLLSARTSHVQLVSVLILTFILGL